MYLSEYYVETDMKYLRAQIVGGVEMNELLPLF